MGTYPVFALATGFVARLLSAAAAAAAISCAAVDITPSLEYLPRPLLDPEYRMNERRISYLNIRIRGYILSI